MKRLCAYVLCECAVCALVSLSPLAIDSEGWYMLYLYVFTPLCALGAPLCASYGGVDPYVSFLPPALITWLLPLAYGMSYPAGMAVICAVIAVFGACAGKEWRARRGKGK